MPFKINIRELLKYTLVSFAICISYFYLAKLSLIVTKSPGQGSAFYIPSGFAIAAIIFFGPRYLPVIFLAKYILGISVDWSLPQNLMSCLASVTEAYVGYYLYKAFKEPIEKRFEFQSNLCIVLLIAFISPIFSALIGVTSLYSMGIIPEDAYFSHLHTWYVGDVLSIIVFIPTFLGLANKERHKFFDFIAPVLAFAFAYLFKFQIISAYLFTIFAVILIPCILGSAMGMYYSLVSIAMVFNYFLIKQTGPFLLGSYNENLYSMQFFLLALGISALGLAGFKKTKLLKSAIVPLILFWFVTGFVYYYYQIQRDHGNNKIMAEVIQDFNGRFTDKIDSYGNAIKAAAGFVASSDNVVQAEWYDFARSISLVDHANGVRAIALIIPKSKTSKAKTFVYPGYIDANYNFEHIVAQPELKVYFDEAIQRLKPILTPSVSFKLANNVEVNMSFLVSSINKNNNFLGWVIVPIEVEKFFQSMIETRYPAIDIDIFESDTKSTPRKIYSKIIDRRLRNEESTNSRITSLNLADRIFTIDWNETLRYVSTQNTQNSLFILFGAIFSMVVTGFILNLKIISLKANRIADSRTLELRESEERFKSLFENSSDAVILFNNHEIIDCNPESLKLFGKRSKRDVLNTPLDDFFTIKDLHSATDSKDLFASKVKEVKYKKMVKFECYCLRATLPFYAEMHLHYIEVNDKFIYQAVVRDISERKKIEQILTRSKDLAEDAARAKSNFLSTMSHEIRTPLNGIIGMINIILDENPHIEIREDLETIKYSADNLLHIVNEVLDYNKIESGKITLEKKSIDLRSLAENVLKVHRPKALEKNLNLELEFDQKIPLSVIGDEYRNTQILNNLLSNSLKFTDTGEVKLKIRLKQKKEDSCIVEFRISDTGIGIDRNKQREIFKDFTQAASDHARKYGGTGLGLAITKRLVEIQNGKIDVFSEPGQGTTFVYTIHFNLKQDILMDANSNSNQKVQDNFTGQRILLVEDNQVNIIVTKKFLEKWGLKVDVAVNGLEAVNHVRAIDYDLVLMDLHMPLMDGFEATKKIREFNKETPIIGLSADVMTESVSSLRAIGMNDFVTKPFRPIDFFLKLKSFF